MKRNDRDLYDYSVWPDFTKEELVCQHTGEENPNVEAFTQLIDGLQELRDWYGKPIIVTSAYRSPKHPIEARKTNPGQHSIAAVDIQVPTEDCHKIVAKAFEMGYTGIGINLKGSKKSRFIHLDERRTAPRVWSY